MGKYSANEIKFSVQSYSLFNNDQNLGNHVKSIFLHFDGGGGFLGAFGKCFSIWGPSTAKSSYHNYFQPQRLLSTEVWESPDSKY